MRAKLSDVRAGRTLYVANVFPFRVGCPANLEVLRVTSRPYKRSFGNLFFHVAGQHFPVSCGDRHIGESNNYNHHYSFTTRKAALRYIRRIQSGCLTRAERELRNKLYDREIEDAHLFPHYASSDALDMLAAELVPGLMSRFKHLPLIKSNRSIINITTP